MCLFVCWDFQGFQNLHVSVRGRKTDKQFSIKRDQNQFQHFNEISIVLNVNYNDVGNMKMSTWHRMHFDMKKKISEANIIVNDDIHIVWVCFYCYCEKLI